MEFEFSKGEGKKSLISNLQENKEVILIITVTLPDIFSYKKIILSLRKSDRTWYTSILTVMLIGICSIRIQFLSWKLHYGFHDNYHLWLNIQVKSLSWQS